MNSRRKRLSSEAIEVILNSDSELDDIDITFSEEDEPTGIDLLGDNFANVSAQWDQINDVGKDSVKRKHPELNCSKSVSSSSSSQLKKKSNSKRSKFSNNIVKDTDILWSQGSVEDSDYASLDMELIQNNPVEQSQVTSTPQKSFNTILAACANTLEELLAPHTETMYSDTIALRAMEPSFRAPSHALPEPRCGGVASLVNRITQRDHNNAVSISKILNFDNNDDIDTDPTGCRVQLSKVRQPELLTNEKIEQSKNNETGIVKPGTSRSEDPEFMNVDEGFQLLNASLTLIAFTRGKSLTSKAVIAPGRFPKVLFTYARITLTLEQEMAAFASVMATACSSSNI
uniref:Uncharacterized protein n=1 Tax=Timema douglasi TaxID=61478 RepID=A0A7R8VKI7_TIMDO|nr:unnamed protein product [Timema douglasi]